MHFKLRDICILLMILTIILIPTHCDNGGTISKGKKIIKKGGQKIKENFPSTKMLTDLYNGTNLKALKLEKMSRTFQKVTRLVPVLKQNNIEYLAYYVLNDVDLVKIAAYRKLIKLFKASKTEEEKNKMYPLLIQSATELIKYYSATNNCPLVKVTFFEGLCYAKMCLLESPSVKAECTKLKALLLEAFFFSHKVEVNRFMRSWLKTTINKSKQLLPDNVAIDYMETKLACEVKLMVENKNAFLNKIKQLYMGNFEKEKNFDCIKHLTRFGDKLVDIGVPESEYLYLLGRAYAKKKDYRQAMSHLENGLKVPVLDTKRRVINKQIQVYLEKLNIQNFAE